MPHFSCTEEAQNKSHVRYIYVNKLDVVIKFEGTMFTQKGV